MPFNDTHAAQFKRAGYVAVTDFFDRADVAAIRIELDRLRAAGAFRNVSTDADGKTRSTAVENLQICPLFDKSDLLRALPFQPKVRAAISSLIGDPAILHLDQIFLKPAQHGAGTGWHQDNAYFKIPNPMLGTAMWIAVHDATKANGTIEVIPGMVNQAMEHSRDPMSDHHIRCYPDESLATPIELPAGGVVFFAYGVPHCTRANKTDRERAGVAYHFLHESQISTNGLKGNGAIVTGPAADGGNAKYGEDLRGRWEAMVGAASL